MNSRLDKPETEPSTSQPKKDKKTKPSTSLHSGQAHTNEIKKMTARKAQHSPSKPNFTSRSSCPPKHHIKQKQTSRHLDNFTHASQHHHDTHPKKPSHTPQAPCKPEQIHPARPWHPSVKGYPDHTHEPGYRKSFCTSEKKAYPHKHKPRIRSQRKKIIR